jgi:hypothetical protein
MDKKKVVKRIAIAGIVALVIMGSVGAYLWFMPKRDVQDASIDFTTTSKALVTEYLKSADLSNKKYLASDGESKILVVKGTVSSVSKNLTNQDVVLLKDAGENAGVICTFLLDPTKTINLKVGDQIAIKGVIYSGASYDEDLEEYMDVSLGKAAIFNAE